MNVFTVPMKLMTAVVLDETTDRVMQELLALGVVDFIEVKRLAPKRPPISMLVRAKKIPKSLPIYA